MRQPEHVVAAVSLDFAVQSLEHDQVPARSAEEFQAPAAAADDVAPRTTEDPRTPRRLTDADAIVTTLPAHVAKEEVGEHVVCAVAGVQQKHWRVRQRDTRDVGVIAEFDLDGRVGQIQLRRPPSTPGDVSSAPASTHRASEKSATFAAVTRFASPGRPRRRSTEPARR